MVNAMQSVFRPAFLVCRCSFVLPLRTRNPSGFGVSARLLVAAGLFHSVNQVREVAYIVDKLRQFLFYPDVQDKDSSRFLGLVGNVVFEAYMLATLLLLRKARLVASIAESFRCLFRDSGIEEKEVRAIRSIVNVMVMYQCLAYYLSKTYDSLPVLVKRDLDFTKFTLSLMSIIAGGVQVAVEIKLWALTYMLQRLFRHTNRVLSQKGGDFSSERLDDLRHQVGRMFELCDAVDSYFGFAVLTFLVSRLVLCQYHCYKIANFVYHAFDGSPAAAIDAHILVTLRNLTLQLIRVGVPVVTCHAVVAEAKKTGPLVNKVANALPESSKDKEALLWFASEVSSRRVKFSACGLFPINYELIFAAAGSCATNIAILMQAHMVSLKQN